MRFRDDLKAISTMIHLGQLGRIYHVGIEWMKRKGTPTTPWFTQQAQSGGGVLIDMGPHMLDLIYWLLGEQKIKKCIAHNANIFLDSGNAYADWHEQKIKQKDITDVEDSSFSLLKFDHLSVTLKLSWVAKIASDYAVIKIFGDQGSLLITTALGFSTHQAYQETKIIFTVNDKITEKILPIPERKTLFRWMLHDFLHNNGQMLPDGKTALKIFRDIQHLYAINEG